MGLMKNFFQQTRKPEGFLGKMMVGGMNGGGHAKMADWGMSHLEVTGVSAIAELGCGGGRNAGELMKRYPEAKLTALDYSDVSVAKASEYNKKAIAEGKCSVVRGNVAELPFENESFDLATAFETVYFWPDLEKCFSEVFRVLKPGGTFLITNESDGTDETSLKFEKIVDGMKCSGCASNVENALDNMDGFWARVSLGRREARVLAKKEYKREDFEEALAKTAYKIADFRELNA